MKAKTMNYEQFLEKVNIEWLLDNGFEIIKNGIRITTETGYIALAIGDEVRVEETETVVRIKTENWSLTVWRNVKNFNLTVFSR